MTRERKLLLLLLCYTLSGFAALLYEIVWTRLLTLHLGHTVAAVSTVLAAFLGGLGVGALIGGGAAARRAPQQALRLFAALELTIGAFALALPYLLIALRPLLAASYGDGGNTSFAVTRIGSSLVLVGMPAAAMGATFPLAVRWIVDCPHSPERDIGALYATNTAGAALGAIATGFFLIPALGLRYTTFIGCALNAISGLGALWIASRDPAAVSPRAVAPSGSRRTSKTTRPVTAARPAAAGRAVAGIALAVTGFVGVANEVAWTRVLALVAGPTTYAFAAILAVFIAGLAAGSGVAAILATRIRRPAVLLAILLALLAAAPAWSMTRVEPGVIAVGESMAASGVNFATAVRLQVLTAATMLLPLALVLGAAFPLALAIAAGDTSERTPRHIGRVYALNTAGAIAGSLAAGFLLIPSAGLQRTIRLSAIVAIAGSLAILWTSRPSRAGALAILAASALATTALLATPRWDMELLSGGAYKYAQYVQSGDLRSTLRAGTTLYHREGSAATVSVRRSAGIVALSIDGKVDASTGGDMLTQKLLAHLPLLLHQQPRRVAIVGLGSGVTLGSALTHPIERADVIEISREVVDASRQFEIVNRRALSDSRTRVIVGDGRAHMIFARGLYDVIISEPSNPWMAGMAALFTREFFQSVRQRLAADGIFCQWAHTYDMREADLRSIAATFAAVFPEGTMWLVGESDLLLVGSPAGVVPRLPAIRAGYARLGVPDDLRTVAVSDLASLLTTYVGGPAELRTFGRTAIVQTDDRMALEFSAPRGLIEREGAANAARLRSLASDAALPPVIRDARAGFTPQGWSAHGAMLLKAEAYAPAYDAFSRAIALQSLDETTIDGFLRAAAGTQRAADAQRMLSAAADRDPHNVPARVGLSRLLASQGDTTGAIGAVEPLMRELPGDPRPYEQAAAVLADAGDAARLRDLGAYLQQRWPARPATAYAVAVVAILEGRLADAHHVATAALSAHPAEARLLNIAGAAAAGLGRKEEARRTFEAALQQDPRDPAVYVNLGLAHLETGDADAAASRFAEALLLDPGSAAAREGLARARSRQRR